MPDKIEDLLAELAGKRNIYTSIKGKIPTHYLEKHELQFDINYAHNSTAIEGNTLSLMETKVLLEDKISIGGKDERLAYYQALDAYGTNGDINPFFMLVARLENNQLDEYLALGKSLKLVDDLGIKLAIAAAKDNDKIVIDNFDIAKEER